MPNHLHGIVIIDTVGAQFIAPKNMQFIIRNRSTINQNEMMNQRDGENQGVINHAPTKITIGAIMRSFKARCTCAINKIYGNIGAPVWHRNYYEHIIRKDIELHKIREYIINNPIDWKNDENYMSRLQNVTD